MPLLNQPESCSVPTAHNSLDRSKEKPHSWLRRHAQKTIMLCAWIVLVSSFVFYTRFYNVSTVDALRDVVDVLQGPYGLIIFLLLCVVRPLTFFSMSLFMLFTGSVFGGILGSAYMFLGNVVSASVAYAIGYQLNYEPETTVSGLPIICRYAGRMRRNSFETTLLLHFMYLPFDVINYLAGFLHIRYRAFILAVVLGIAPGVFVFVTAGSMLHIEDVLAGNFESPAINPWVLVASAILIVLCVITSQYLKRCEQQRDTSSRA